MVPRKDAYKKLKSPGVKGFAVAGCDKNTGRFSSASVQHEAKLRVKKI